MTYPRPGECIRFHCLEMADQRADKMGWKLGSGVLDVYLAVLSQYNLCTFKFPLIHLPRIPHTTSFESDENL